MTAGPTTTDAAPSMARRLDVQGLRAVASLLVASYHIWFGTVSGGVDVFFVLGGYLLVTSIVGEVERSGGFAIGRALRSQAGRLLPMMGLVLVVAGVAAFVLRPAIVARDVGLDLVAAATFWENWRLFDAATAYVESGLERSVVQHFWAMGVQGQFTFAAILVLGALAWLLRRRSAATFRHVATALLLVAVVASFAYAVAQVASDPVRTYYDTAARAWELALGGAVALLQSRLRLHAVVRAILAVAGLVALLVAGVLVSEAPHPGVATLLPTIAAIAVLVAGVGGPVGPVGALLSSRPLVFVGNASYGLFLWHWPVLWVAVELGGDPGRPIGVFEGIGIILVGLLLSIGSTRLLAVLARVRPARPPWSAVLVPLVAAAGLVVAVLPPAAPAPIAEAGEPGTPAGSVAAMEQRVRVATTGVEPLQDGFYFGESARNPEWIVDGCGSVGPDELDRCSYGSGPSELWLVGDSHAATWAPAVRWAVGEETRVQLAGAEGCPFTSSTVLLEHLGDPDGEACLEHTGWVRSALLDRVPDLVVLSQGAWWVGSEFDHLGAEATDDVIASTGELVAELTDAGIPVLLLDSPPPVDTLEACAAALGHGAGADADAACIADLTPSHLHRSDALAAAIERAGGITHPTLGWFCDIDALACPLAVEGIPVWSDAVHMSWAEANVVRRLVASAIDDVAPGLVLAAAIEAG